VASPRAANLIVGRVAGALFATAWMVIAARALQPEAFGHLAVVIGIGTVAAVIAEGGYPVLVADAVAAEPTLARSVIRGALRVRLPLALGAVAVTVVAGGITGGSTGAATGAAYGIWIMGSAVQTTLGSAMRGVGRPGADGAAEAISRAGALALGVVLLQIWSSPVTVTLAYAMGVVVAAGWLMLVVRRVTAADHHATPWAVPVKRTATLGLVAVLATVYNRIDVWLLAAIASSRDVGLYAAGYRLYEGLILPAAAFGALLVPAAARSREHARTQIRRHLAAALALTACGAAALAAVAPMLVERLFGASFDAADGPVRVLALAALPAAALSVTAPLASLTVKGSGIRVYVIGVVLTTGCNLALVPRFGPLGAAWSMVLSQSVLAALFVHLTLRAAGPPASARPSGTSPARTNPPAPTLASPLLGAGPGPM
jgi:O-antigen/teichoic acid export membrane protein